MYKLLLVDFAMPNMDGPTLARSVRQAVSKKMAKDGEVGI